ncbi:MAG TPA: hypothetical protein VHF69_07075 [Candidatus Synoicihabitans sp.]|nr:hypothetical protein [Candidatus Synoicihabitans sp.]
MLTVYVAGLIYFNGCKQNVKRMYAPDGTDEKPLHYASLWVAADLLEENATQWWNGFRHSYAVEGGQVVEFRMPGPAEITFPDLGHSNGTCDDLETKLGKLKKKKQDGTEEDFEIDPATAQTIAEVTIRGGDIRPRRFKETSLVEWTMNNPPTLQITAALKNNPGQSRTITLKPSAGGVSAEVVFANTHDLFAGDGKGFRDDDDHDVALFKKLNPALAGETLVSKKAQGNAGQLSTANAIIHRLRDFGRFAGGDPPNCCNS